MWCRIVFVGLLASIFLFGHATPRFGPTGEARAQSGTVSRIVVEGNQRIEAETVRTYMQIQAGDSFSADLMDESLQSLFQTGLFSDVRISRRGRDLVVVVEENPIINRIAFEGNSALKNDALEKEVELKPRVVFTRARVQADVDRIITLYRRSGQFNARVEPKIIRLPQNRIDLVFEITEGERTVVRSISFIGNRKFSDRKLRSVIITEQTTFWKFWSNADTYDPDRLNYDKELLRRHYLKNGYADFRVLSATAELAPNGQDFFLTFTVEEGERYVFGKIEVDPGRTGLDLDALASELTTVSGETYDASKIDKSIEKLTLEAGKQGYAFARVEPVVERVSGQQAINLTYQMNEGSRVYIERIDIVGNVRTIDKVIRREIRLVEGDAYNRVLVDRARRRITALDFFGKIDILEQPGSAPDKVILVVSVEEKSTGTLNFSAGYSTIEQVVGTISVTERNLLGRGLFAKLGTSLSFKRQNVDLSFTDPYFLDRNMSFGVDVFATETNQKSESSFSSLEIGGGFRLGFPISEDARVETHYSFANRDVTATASAPAAIARSDGKSDKSEVGITYLYNTLDNPLAPTQGLRTVLSADLAGVGGDVFFWRVEGKASYFHPIPVWDWDNVVLMLRGTSGAMDGWNDKSSPVLDRFFKGGNSFRGFERAGIGPRTREQNDAVGGQIYAIGTVELTFPLGLPDGLGVRGAIFSDFGTLFDASGPAAAFGKHRVRDSMAMRLTVGGGIVWRSPFGPIRLDVTEALMKATGDRTQRIQFSAGASF